jgi:hypothetical protein
LSAGSHLPARPASRRTNVITREKLLLDPEGYGSKYAFLVQRGTACHMKAKAVVGKPKQIVNFCQVQGGSRVLTASLVQKARTCTVAVADFDAGGDSSTTFPIYYLPWDKNQVIRVTLKPSKHRAVVREPDVFFTDNLNGCMVTVEGPPDRPTVYHSNVMDYLGSPGGDTSMEQDVAELYIAAKAMAMEKGYKAMSREHDKAGESRKGLLHPKSITQDAYQTLVGRPSAAEDETRWITKVMADRGVKFNENGGVIQFEQSLGTVFGVRGDRYWRFFYQRLLCGSVYGKRPRTGPQEPGLVWLYDDWRPLYCREFWPFGEGTITL